VPRNLQSRRRSKIASPYAAWPLKPRVYIVLRVGFRLDVVVFKPQNILPEPLVKARRNEVAFQLKVRSEISLSPHSNPPSLIHLHPRAKPRLQHPWLPRLCRWVLRNVSSHGVPQIFWQVGVHKNFGFGVLLVAIVAGGLARCS